jgi:hypothetical protein
MGRSRIVWFNSRQNPTNVAELTQRDPCNLPSELFFVLNYPRPPMAQIVVVELRKRKCPSELLCYFITRSCYCNLFRLPVANALFAVVR